jgi:hypothetical protein
LGFLKVRITGKDYSAQDLDGFEKVSSAITVSRKLTDSMGATGQIF